MSSDSSPEPNSKRIKTTITTTNPHKNKMEAAMMHVESLLKYRFRNPALLEQALTHSSDLEHVSYQRLEYLGDAAIGLAISNYIYLTNPDAGPGDLSALRAANITTEKLARVSVTHDLYKLLRRNCPKLDRMVEEFTLAVKRDNEGELYGLTYGGSTVKAPKVLADIVESIAAAVYVDCNFNLEKLWTVIRGLLEPIITAENLDEQPVATLHEYCQKRGKTLDVKNWKTAGNINVTNVFVDGELLGIGTSDNQNISKLNAARDALQKFDDLMEDEGVVCNSEEEIANAKHNLYELCRKKHWSKPVYSIVTEEGPAHDKKFVSSVQVTTSNRKFYKVSDPMPRVRDAESSAATKALYEITRPQKIYQAKSYMLLSELKYS